jgi:hypothetical protein
MLKAHGSLQNHYWYHCKIKPATRQCREVGLLPSLPNCMFKNKPLLILNICRMNHTLDYFLYRCKHDISNWKQHLSGFKIITCCCLKQIRKFITVKMKCTYWYLKCIIKKTHWCCVFLVYNNWATAIGTVWFYILTLKEWKYFLYLWIYY